MTQITSLSFSTAQEAVKARTYLRNCNVLSEAKTVSRGHHMLRVHLPVDQTCVTMQRVLRKKGFNFMDYGTEVEARDVSAIIEHETPVATTPLGESVDHITVTKTDDGWKLERTLFRRTDTLPVTTIICTTCGGNIGKAVIEQTLVLLQALAIEAMPVYYVGV